MVSHTDTPPAYDAAGSGNTPSSAVSLSASVNGPDDNHLLITITPPQQPLNPGTEKPGKRAPVDICCVIDVSGYDSLLAFNMSPTHDVISAVQCNPRLQHLTRKVGLPPAVLRST